MQYITLPGPLPVPARLVVAVTEWLKLQETVTRYLGPAGGARIFPHEMPVLAPPAGVWGAVVVRHPVNPFGEESSVLGWRKCTIRVHTYAPYEVNHVGYDPRLYLAALHQRIDEVLKGRVFQAEIGARQLYPLWRTADPGQAEYVPELTYYHTVATYRTDLEPLPIP